jgi:hypothetical protein
MTFTFNEGTPSSFVLDTTTNVNKTTQFNVSVRFDAEFVLDTETALITDCLLSQQGVSSSNARWMFSPTPLFANEWGRRSPFAWDDGTLFSSINIPVGDLSPYTSRFRRYGIAGGSPLLDVTFPVNIPAGGNGGAYGAGVSMGSDLTPLSVLQPDVGSVQGSFVGWAGAHTRNKQQRRLQFFWGYPGSGHRPRYNSLLPTEFTVNMGTNFLTALAFNKDTGIIENSRVVTTIESPTNATADRSFPLFGPAANDPGKNVVMGWFNPSLVASDYGNGFVFNRRGPSLWGFAEDLTTAQYSPVFDNDVNKGLLYGFNVGGIQDGAGIVQVVRRPS